MLFKSKKYIYVVLLILICFIFSGCGLYNSIGKISKTEKSLKKTVWAASFKNSSFYQTDTANSSMKDIFLKALNKYDSDNIYIDKIEKEDKSTVNIPKTVSGDVDNFALNKIGIDHGINYIIIVNFVDFTVLQKKKGIFFKKKKAKAKLTFLLTVYNTKTAAKLIEYESVITSALKESEYNRIKNKEVFDISSVNLAIKKTVMFLGKTAWSEISKQTFAGYINKCNDGVKITVVPGKNAGIIKDCLFDVFSKGKIIKGFSQRMYIIPGHKIGEIKIVSATEKNAQAVIVSGDGFEQGCVIKVKNKE